ncbi:DUF1214 domain-containing protein [Labrys wisconsinensis]|uniref:DUF1214 domain-containing protein n=1 Tax=Labrys wisconsinensis TaxID=425677 RepID=A0ABU0J637_9HYPH|nr:DUF1214 domain-containing protein [Labrys wisconsinensis]MDQ0469718.1 hypothetical protein [Labrys wisconsinensis]
MRSIPGFLYALTLGAVVGLGLTWWTLAGGPGFNALRIGPWSAWPQAGTPDADRYARAGLARSGDLPLGSGEGLAFVATRDSAGAALDGRCRYRIEPIAPPARWWTLALYDADGHLPDSPVGRHGFTSAEVLRRGDGVAAVVVAPDAAPGNWLPSGPAGGPFRLVLRLYDTPVSTSAARSDAVVLPDIIAEGCP